MLDEKFMEPESKYEKVKESLHKHVTQYLEGAKVNTVDELPNVNRRAHVKTLELVIKKLQHDGFTSEKRDGKKPLILKGFIHVICYALREERSKLKTHLLDALKEINKINEGDEKPVSCQTKASLNEARVFYNSLVFKKGNPEWGIRVANDPFSAIEGFDVKKFEDNLFDCIAANSKLINELAKPPSESDNKLVKPSSESNNNSAKTFSFWNYMPSLFSAKPAAAVEQHPIESAAPQL